jgi:hypothetical protein
VIQARGPPTVVILTGIHKMHVCEFVKPISIHNVVFSVTQYKEFGISHDVLKNLFLCIKILVEMANKLV